jgi:hypothetical protein
MRGSGSAGEVLELDAGTPLPPCCSLYELTSCSLRRAHEKRASHGWRRRAGRDLAVLVGVTFGVRDEGDGIKAGALELAGDEGVLEGRRAGDAEAEDDVRKVLGPAVAHRVGAGAEHAKLLGGGGVVAVEVEGDGVGTIREGISPMGRHGVERARAAAGEG